MGLSVTHARFILIAFVFRPAPLLTAPLSPAKKTASTTKKPQAKSAKKYFTRFNGQRIIFKRCVCNVAKLDRVNDRLFILRKRHMTCSAVCQCMVSTQCGVLFYLFCFFHFFFHARYASRTANTVISNCNTAPGPAPISCEPYPALGGTITSRRPPSCIPRTAASKP